MEFCAMQPCIQVGVSDRRISRFSPWVASRDRATEFESETPPETLLRRPRWVGRFFQVGWELAALPAAKGLKNPDSVFPGKLE